MIIDAHMYRQPVANSQQLHYNNSAYIFPYNFFYENTWMEVLVAEDSRQLVHY